MVDLLVSFNPHASSLDLKQHRHFLDHVIFLYNYYLELACYDEQNGSQTFKIGARITKLWQFKAWKMKKLQQEDRLAIFNPGLWLTGFFRCGEECYHFQQELTVSKMMIKLFINSFTMGL